MQESNINNDQEKYNDYDFNAINIKFLFDLAFRHKFLIIFITSLVSIFSIFYSLSIPNKYKSEVLVEVRNDNQSTNILSQYSGVASMAGIRIPSASIDKTSLAIESIKSRDFFNYVFKKHNLLPFIMAPAIYELDTNRLIYDEDYFNFDKNKWVKEPPSYQEAHLKFLQNIKIEKSKNSGFLNISYSHISPYAAKNILDIIILEINQTIKEKDLIEINKSLNYLTLQVDKNEIYELRNAINNLIEAELKKKMVNRINDDYLLKIIDSSYVPYRKFAPNRSVIVVVYTFFGLFLSIIMVILKYNFFDKKKNIL